VLLTHERYCEEIVAQADHLAALLDGTDGALPVPTCPAWTIADLVDHVTGNLRALGDAVRTAEVRTTYLRAGGTAVDTRPGGRGVPVKVPEAAAAITPELGRAAVDAAAALRRAGPRLPVRLCGLDGTARVWARRTAHDLLVHRADAALALGRPFDASPDAGADALDEILELFAGPPVPPAEQRPHILLHATDTAAAWSISPARGSFTWRRGAVGAGRTPGRTAGAELAGPVTELLLVTYRRLRPERTNSSGEVQLLGSWLDSLAFT